MDSPRATIADCSTSVSIFASLRDVGATFFFDSARPHRLGGRFSYVGFPQEIEEGDLARGFRDVRKLLRSIRAHAHVGREGFPFIGGAMFVGGGGQPLLMGTTSAVAVIDNLKGEVTAFEVGETSRASSILAAIEAADGTPSELPRIASDDPIEHLHTGDQLSKHDLTGAYDVLRVLRVHRYYPYVVYAQAGEVEVLGGGAAPFLDIDSRTVTATTMLDGTPRSRRAAQRMAAALAAVTEAEPEVREHSRALPMNAGEQVLSTARGRLTYGRSVADALLAVTDGLTPHDGPIAGLIGWDGRVRSTRLDDAFSIRGGVVVGDRVSVEA